jgi:hypothetical protein
MVFGINGGKSADAMCNREEKKYSEIAQQPRCETTALISKFD